jgi:hypothetical protein
VRPRCRPAHRHPDVGQSQRRRVVDTVAGHRHRVAGLSQGLDDAQLVKRGDARHDGGIAQQLVELPRVGMLQAIAAEHGVCTRVVQEP